MLSQRAVVEYLKDEKMFKFSSLQRLFLVITRFNFSLDYLFVYLVNKSRSG